MVASNARKCYGVVIVVAVMMGVLAGCGGSRSGPGGSGDGDGQARQEQQARDALQRWDAAVAAAGGDQTFVPLFDAMTGMVGEWEVANGDNKTALLSGEVVAMAALTAPAPATADVRWSDGHTKTVRTVSAAQAVQRIAAQGTGDCPDCAPLEVTGATWTTVTVRTSRGPATAPGWELSLKGTSVSLTHVAVATADLVAVTPPPWDPYNAPGGFTIDAATVSADGRRLTVSFVGSPGTSEQPCGADYTASAVESATGVVIIVAEHRNQATAPSDTIGCPAIGAPRTATVDLAQPLGQRTVLDVVQGLPVAVTAA